MKKVILLCVIVGAAIGAYAAFDITRFGHTALGSSSDEKVIEVASGMTMAKLAKLLKEQNLIKDDYKLS